MPEDDLPNLIVTNAASGDLPDVVHHPIDFSIGWAEQGILDVEAAAAVVESLGADTFNAATRWRWPARTTSPWPCPPTGGASCSSTAPTCSRQPVWSRRTRSSDILAAAEALHADGMNGITVSTDPADVFTQQTFEFLALGAGCNLIEDDEVALDSEACVNAIATYADLIQNYSPGTVQNVDTTQGHLLRR